MKPFYVLMILAIGFFAGALPVQAEGFGASRNEKEIKPSGKTYFVSPGDTQAEQTQEEKSLLPSETVSQPAIAEEPVSQESRRMDQISKAARLHAARVVNDCLGSWEKQGCLRVVSDTYLTAAALYAEDLEKSGHKNEQESLKEHCAASTAATRLDDIPAYAMRSAFVECSNELYAIYERTQIMADQELSQLMVMAVLCLDKDPRCGLMETGLKESVGQ